MDSACLVWEFACGERGACWLYDSNVFRMFYHGAYTAGKNSVDSIIAPLPFASSRPRSITNRSHWPSRYDRRYPGPGVRGGHSGLVQGWEHKFRGGAGGGGGHRGGDGHPQVAGRAGGRQRLFVKVFRATLMVSHGTRAESSVVSQGVASRGVPSSPMANPSRSPGTRHEQGTTLVLTRVVLRSPKGDQNDRVRSELSKEGGAGPRKCP